MKIKTQSHTHEVNTLIKTYLKHTTQTKLQETKISGNLTQADHSKEAKYDGNSKETFRETQNEGIRLIFVLWVHKKHYDPH